MALFILRAEFWPTKENGDVDFKAIPKLKFWQFDNINKAMLKFMRVIPHFHKHSNNSKPCNLAGELAVVVNNEFTVLESWDWSKVEAKDNWSRSSACAEWINSIANHIPATVVALNTKLVDTLVASGLCSSNSDARRQIQQGAVRINDEKVSDINALLKDSCIVSKGKKHKAQITVQP